MTDGYVERRGFSVWPFAYRTRVEILGMCQVKPKHRFMKTLFKPIGFAPNQVIEGEFFRFVKLEIPIDQMRWEGDFRWEAAEGSCFLGWRNEEVHERAAEGRNRPPFVADEIEATGHAKALDSEAFEYPCFQLRVHGS